MRVFRNVTDLIGRTPLIALSRLSGDCPGTVLAKLERQNPGGSVKDRTALWMIEDAERRELLSQGAVIVEPTSGNTGVGLAMIAAVRGYRVVLTMPDTMSQERRKLLAAYGAELVLTPGEKGMRGAIERANEIAACTPGSFMPRQFENPANPSAHRESTGPEIWDDTDGRIDIFVAGVGTGGTVSGVGEYLKGKNPAIQIIAVEPMDSPVLSQGHAGSHSIQGIGAGFVPENYHAAAVDEIMPVSGKDAMEMGKRLARQEGLLSGISSGAAVFAAVMVAMRPESQGKLIVALLPDTGERYLTTELFAE